jgi:hypothetical protein
MAKFSVNLARFDPYKNFKFRIALFATAGALVGLVAGRLLGRRNETGENSDA